MMQTRSKPLLFDPNAVGGCSIVTRSQRLLKIVAMVAFSLATIGCSLRQERADPSTVVWAGRTPSSAIETAFAALNASTDGAAVNAPKAQGSCNDLEFSFLHAACSKKHRKRALIRQHRVATFVVGRPDAITSSVKLPAQAATPRQEVPPDSERSSKSEGKKAACTQPWPYYDRTCILKQTGGNTHVVRVIALERQTPVR
jgi:hypothetical protein